MKKAAFIILFLSAVTIIYLFIKEQFNGVVLSRIENLILSITYLLVGISLLALLRLKNKENKEGNLKK
jgi:amino acid transporter